MSKTLVAYFSATGNTEKLAKTLAAAAGAELYRITLEMQDPDCRPDLANCDAPVADADVIFLGFPVWWYREPSIIDSFLEAYDFSGKTVVPFLTSGGSELGEGQERIETLAKGAAVLPGKRFRPRAGESDLKAWISCLNLE